MHRDYGLSVGGGGDLRDLWVVLELRDFFRRLKRRQGHGPNAAVPVAPVHSFPVWSEGRAKTKPRRADLCYHLESGDVPKIHLLFTGAGKKGLAIGGPGQGAHGPLMLPEFA